VDSVVRQETAGFVVPYPAENRAFGLDDETLGRVAVAAGGRVLHEPREAFARDLPMEGQSRIPLWPYLLGAATLLFPLDVGVRRLKISPSYLRRKLWVPVAGTLSRARGVPSAASRLAMRYRPR
jgi:hypothetical protein